MVNLSLDQSTELPKRLSCSQMREPYWSFHFQTSSTNFSRPRSWRETPLFASCFSTTVCVAMPAWSVPGTYNVASPFMRCHLVNESSIAAVRAWPKWRLPVTFGGGITMTNFCFALSCATFSASQPYQPLASHHSCHEASTSDGSYVLAIAGARIFFWPLGVGAATVSASSAFSRAAFSALALAAFSALALAFSGSTAQRFGSFSFFFPLSPRSMRFCSFLLTFLGSSVALLEKNE
mmetsp:Transcript_6070/g.19785  ORF Transcript_6070/g.19785 Transcript_6070/m.19785 type:complete len:236 (+) Transcript_6070:2938-3645(+)